jgi:hypothetical protein
VTAEAAANVPTPPLTSGSGVPAVVREWIPQAFAAAHPATVEAAWAGLVSLRNGLPTMLIAAYSFAPPDEKTSIPTFLTYVVTHPWGAVAPIIFSWLRAHVAFGKAKAPAP